jgi:WD40 repeat protein
LQPIVLSPDGRWLATRNNYPEVGLTLIDLANGDRQPRFLTEGCSAAAFSSDSRLLAVGEHDSNDIFVWDLEKRKVLRRIDDHRTTVSALAFAPDSRHLAALDDNAVLALWDIATDPRKLWEANSSPGARNVWGASVAFSPDGRTILSANALMMVSIWHAATGREFLSLTNAPVVGIRGLSTISFCDRGRYIVGRDAKSLHVIGTELPSGESGQR